MRLFLVLATLLVGVSCANDRIPTVTADYRFSNASGFGTQNSGFISPGTLFVWNISTNELDAIDVLELTLSKQNAGRTLGTQSSTGVSAVDFIGVPVDLVESVNLLSVHIGASSRYEVVDAHREDYISTITALSDYVTSLVSSGVNADLIFHPRNDAYRIVLVDGVLRARQSTLSLAGADLTNADRVVRVTVGTPVGNVGALDVRMAAETACGLGKPQGTVGRQYVSSMSWSLIHTTRRVRLSFNSELYSPQRQDFQRHFGKCTKRSVSCIRTQAQGGIAI